MNTLALYDKVCLQASRRTTQAYSTSFTLGIRSLHRRFRDPVHAIYGFVRFADEIVDTFHAHDRRALLARFREDTLRAIDDGISSNPILHSFQNAVRTCSIDHELIHTFLGSMEMDLDRSHHDERSFNEYILGSAEVVGLMCLRVFCEGDGTLFQRLKPSAMKLGAAFQKVNFLRDIKDDHEHLGRTYFPGVDVGRMSTSDKRSIEADIQGDFDAALDGIRLLPKGARFGVYLAFTYYMALFQKIRALNIDTVLRERIHVRNRRKLALFTKSLVRHSFGII